LMSRAGDPFSDGLLMHAVRLLARHLPNSGRSDDLSIRSELMIASLLCGQGTDHTGAGIAIPLGHAISARFHIDNGLANAVVLPHVIRFNAEAAQAGLEKLATALGRDPTREPALAAVIDTIQAIFEQMGTPQRLRDLGVTRESLAELAAISMQDWFVRDNPRPVRDASELEQVLEEAW
jgi:alcohol dehydrogenase class IV